MLRNRPGSEKGEALWICCVLFNVLLKKSMIENTLEGYVVIIDYSKAFDNVSHPKLFLTVEKMGFPKHLIKLIEGL